jgi:hypothetical protein
MMAMEWRALEIPQDRITKQFQFGVEIRSLSIPEQD